MGHLQLVIFDVDGTLVDSQHDIVAAQAKAFAAHGLRAPDRSTALSVVGLSLREAFLELAGPDAPVDSLAEAYKDAWLDLHGHPDFAQVLYPGAAALVATLAVRGDVMLGIATGKSRRGVARVIAAQKWDGVFATIQTSDGHPSKPHPSMVLAALAEAGVEPEDAVMIGDTTFDMAMAVSAGVRPVGVAWGYHEPATLLTSGASVVAEDFGALRTILESNTGEKPDRR